MDCSSCVGVLHCQRRHLGHGPGDRDIARAEDVAVCDAPCKGHRVNVMDDRSPDTVNGIADEHHRPATAWRSAERWPFTGFCLPLAERLVRPSTRKNRGSLPRWDTVRSERCERLVRTRNDCTRYG